MEELTEKVQRLLSKPGANFDNISRPSAPSVTDAMEAAICSEFGDRSQDIAFHLSDWISDGAFLVAVHLFPDQFTREEILEGVSAFLHHAPNHAAAAAALAGNPVYDVFQVGSLTPFVAPDEEDEG